MDHILANIAWSSNGWTKPTKEGKNFQYVKDGNPPHEGYNFAFDHSRNRQKRDRKDVIYGYVETNGAVPRKYEDANNGEGICFFSSVNPHYGKRWIVGLYANCTVTEMWKQPSPYGILSDELVNLYGPKNQALLFYPQSRVELSTARHLKNQKRIGRINFANIEDEQAIAILEDAVARHRALPHFEDYAHVQNLVTKLETLLLEVGGDPSSVLETQLTDDEVSEADTFLEGAIARTFGEVRQRNPNLAAAVKKRDEYVCQVCGFSFESFYGELGGEYAECHHLDPVREWTEEHEADVSRAITVCSNCHAMIHRHRKALGVDELRDSVGQHGWHPNECRK